jgi:di/tricarboxylate transporter
VRELRFREQFNAAVVAVARKGERIRAMPGDIHLQSGDILLLDTGSSFAQQNKVRAGYTGGWACDSPAIFICVLSKPGDAALLLICRSCV